MPHRNSKNNDRYSILIHISQHPGGECYDQYIEYNASPEKSGHLMGEITFPKARIICSPFSRKRNSLLTGKQSNSISLVVEELLLSVSSISKVELGMEPLSKSLIP